MCRIFGVPDKWGNSFRSCAHGRIQRGQLCTSAIISEGFPFPLVPQMILRRHKSLQKNNLAPDEPERSAMVAFVYRLMLGTPQ